MELERLRSELKRQPQVTEDATILAEFANILRKRQLDSIWDCLHELLQSSNA
jgi:hypothetical protein